MSSRSTFPDAAPACAQTQPQAGHLANDGSYFSEVSQSLGLTIPQYYDASLAWLFQGSVFQLQQTSFSGGVTATYVNGDCWPDLVYTSGSQQGVVAYLNQAGTGGAGFAVANVLPGLSQIGGLYTAVGAADLQGDYRRELVLGNLTPGSVRILKPDDSGLFHEIASYTDSTTSTVKNGLPMQRDTFGISFGDYNNDGYPDMYLGHWDLSGLPGSAPAFWVNNGGQTLKPLDGPARLGTAAGINQNYQFTPQFADIDGDGWQDLLIASDFLTTIALQNVANTTTATQAQTARAFANVTDTSVIKDENGMGTTLGDFSNSGQLDWFVTDVYYAPQTPLTYVGIKGNHLYHNISTPGNIRFQDVTQAAGVGMGHLCGRLQQRWLA